VPGQLVPDVVAVGQFLDFAHAVDQHHVLEPFVGLGVVDDAYERRQAAEAFATWSQVPRAIRLGSIEPGALEDALGAIKRLVGG
jgi:hypothetical protein